MKWSNPKEISLPPQQWQLPSETGPLWKVETLPKTNIIVLLDGWKICNKELIKTSPSPRQNEISQHRLKHQTNLKNVGKL